MIEFFKENINWIKDIFTLIFAATGTIIAILTYRKARATILQPIRTEVIKKQSEILSRLLKIYKSGESLDEGIDYLKMVQLNVFLTLRDFGFIFKEHEEFVKKITDEIIGWMPCGQTNNLKDVEIVGIFNYNSDQNKAVIVGAEKYKNLKQGKIDIDKIYLTKEHHNYVNILTEFCEDPFMPTLIQNTISELLSDISKNLTVVLKRELELFMLGFAQSHYEENKTPHFNPIGVYNNFNHSRVHHRNLSIRLKQEIRKYLRIDDKWE